ncbi:uncharacterized protein LOC127118747 [Lathyrus oleraceus]|uniref:uncharacterized protein LOC127118747 n=1 Tax=Pisum sativum TaxID=3888 RepID=UPI0021CF88AF|nr:uncharacterized protein LOC127118747 [Pisum sativum]
MSNCGSTSMHVKMKSEMELQIGVKLTEPNFCREQVSSCRRCCWIWKAFVHHFGLYSLWFVACVAVVHVTCASILHTAAFLFDTPLMHFVLQLDASPFVFPLLFSTMYLGRRLCMCFVLQLDASPFVFPLFSLWPAFKWVMEWIWINWIIWIRVIMDKQMKNWVIGLF